MRNSIILVGLGVTLAAVSAARAQTVEAIVMPAAKPAVVAQAPVAVPPSGVVLPPEPIVAATAPVETVETVRTVTSTEPPRRVYRRVVRPWTVDRVTTVTRTTTVRTVTSLEPRRRVYRRVVHPRVAAGPAYGGLVRGPRLYDVVTPAPAVAPAVAAQPAIPPAPVVGATIATPAVMPTYQYIYQPDRILVVDPYTNIAVQAIPR